MERVARRCGRKRPRGSLGRFKEECGLLSAVDLTGLTYVLPVATFALLVGAVGFLYVVYRRATRAMPSIRAELEAFATQKEAALRVELEKTANEWVEKAKVAVAAKEKALREEFEERLDQEKEELGQAILPMLQAALFMQVPHIDAKGVQTSVVRLRPEVEQIVAGFMPYLVASGAAWIKTNVKLGAPGGDAGGGLAGLAMSFLGGGKPRGGKGGFDMEGLVTQFLPMLFGGNRQGQAPGTEIVSMPAHLLRNLGK